VDSDGTFRGPPLRKFAATAKRLLPEAVVRELQRYRAFESHERALYLKIRISNKIGFTNPRLARVPGAARSFLFVCFGNIMRSPMCGALLSRELAYLHNPQLTVMSAGLNSSPGRPAHPWAVEAAKEFGVSLEDHRARSLTPEMVDSADVIFVMDYQNQVQLLSRWGAAKKKIHLLSAYAGKEYRSVEIRDPYYMGLEGTRACYRILNTCVQNLVREISNEDETATTLNARTTQTASSKLP